MTFEYTRAGHFQFGYKNSSTLVTRWLGRRETTSEIFVARYGRALSSFDSWRSANTQAARQILEMASANCLTPVVCCSGGLDSEITLLSFFTAWREMGPSKRPALEIATLDLVDSTSNSRHNLNHHDTCYVEKFVQHAKPAELDLKCARYELDIHEFFASAEFVNLAEETQVLSPAVLTQIWLCQAIHRANSRALPIIGQGEIHLIRDASPEGTYHPAVWSISETENLCGLYRYFIGRGLPAIPGFFQYTPEQFESQLRTNPVLHDLIANSRYGKLGTRTSKAEILAFDYPELEARPKYTGFEKIEALYDERRTFLASREGASDAKWLRPVFKLMDDLRPIAKSAIQFDDWKFSWGRDGEMKSARTSEHDIFATEWSNLDFLRANSRMSPAEFLSTIRTFLREINSRKIPCTTFTPFTPFTLLHDGSPLARIFQRLLLRESARDSAGESTAKTIDARNFSRSSSVELAAKLARLVLVHGTTNSNLLARILLIESAAHSSSNDHILIPILHGRIVNAEFDRELQSTLSRPRFVWTENEELAALAIAADQTAPSRCILPWTSSALAKASLALTNYSEWNTSDEPGPSNRSILENHYAECLKLLEESGDEKSLASESAAAFAKLRFEIDACLQNIDYKYPASQVSAYNLASFQTSAFNQPPDKLFGFPSVSAVEPHGAFENELPRNLKLISEDAWLEHAMEKTPELRLGSNLFFQQEVAGFSLLQKGMRAYVALIDDATSEEVAFAQISLLKMAPHGRLRIRGVTTRAGFERKGHATKLLTEIASHLRSVRSTHLRGIDRIDVYAAPEVVNAFRAAGFSDDVTRVTRAEESVDVETGLLVATDRELTPLTFSLGES